MSRRRPSAGQLREQRKAATKRRDLDTLAALQADKIQPGRVYSATTLHDGHCQRPRGGPCDCDPSGVVLAELNPSSD